MSTSGTIGVLGGGQLGQMIAQAGKPLGFEFRFLDPAADAPARSEGNLIIGEFDDTATLDQLASGVLAVTFEFENVPVASIEHLARRVPVRPPAASLAGTQDRLIEKQTFNELGVPTTRFAAVSTREEFDAALKQIGLPCVVKTRREGYDGKGQGVVRNDADAQSTWTLLGGRPLLVEEFIRFERELSIIGVRGVDGAMVFYPLVENRHDRGILRLSRAPASHVAPAFQQQAEGHARAIMDRYAHVGVFTIEFFQRNDVLLANEMAPRVHNSGHWTIEGAATSQFENHVRAITGMPLGSCESRGASAMVNIIGAYPTDDAMAEIRVMPSATLHLYGKEARAGRKLGHATVTGVSQTAIEPIVRRILELCPHV